MQVFNFMVALSKISLGVCPTPKLQTYSKHTSKNDVWCQISIQVFNFMVALSKISLGVCPTQKLWSVFLVTTYWSKFRQINLKISLWFFYSVNRSSPSQSTRFPFRHCQPTPQTHSGGPLEGGLPRPQASSMKIHTLRYPLSTSLTFNPATFFQNPALNRKCWEFGLKMAIDSIFDKSSEPKIAHNWGRTGGPGMFSVIENGSSQESTKIKMKFTLKNLNC